MRIVIIESSNPEHSDLLKQLSEKENNSVLIIREKEASRFIDLLQAKVKAGERLHKVLSALYRKS